MDPKLAGKLVVAISSRALFDLDEAHQIFSTGGLDHYRRHQIDRENDVLPKGTGFPLVEGLLKLRDPQGKDLVEVVLVSRNDADTGLRVMNSVEHYALPISRAVFTDGSNPYEYLKPFDCHLFLSANKDDVTQAFQQGFAAGLVYQPPYSLEQDANVVRIAFDGDAVLFSHEAEETYRNEGLEQFHQQERQSAEIPLNPGPFKGFLEALCRIQKLFDADRCPIRTALVTARSAPAHKRAIKTLRDWDVRVNESFFLGGVGKDGVLGVFRPHIFFDDHEMHCIPAASKLPTAQVPSPATREPVSEQLSSKKKKRVKPSAGRKPGRPRRRSRIED
ncbi:5'-nucleotidase [bacterium]|jgi:5'-nucleotidase|nr:5'-nucleotidase [bacterium]